MTRRMNHATASFAVLAALFTASLFASPAQAEITWPAPPACKESQWHRAPSGQVGLYTKAEERQDIRQYGGGTEVRYIWIFAVEVPSYPYGLMLAGRAERHCGTDFFPTDVA